VKKVHKGDKGTQMPRCMTVTTGKRYQLAESWTEVTCAKCQAARRADEKAICGCGETLQTKEEKELGRCKPCVWREEKQTADAERENQI
jgi:hypothetical protein